MPVTRSLPRAVVGALSLALTVGGFGVAKAAAMEPISRVSLSESTVYAVTAVDRAATSQTSRSVATAPLKVIGLGDSVPAAGNCEGCESYVVTAGTKLAAAQKRPAEVSNTAVGGYTTDDVLTLLSDVDVRSQVATSDVVIIQIGANDFSDDDTYDPTCTDASTSGCYDDTMSTATANLRKIVQTVQGLQTRSGARVVLLGYWNVFVDGQVGQQEGQIYVAGSDSLTRWVNTEISRIAAQNGAVYADAYTPFKGTDGADDPSAYLVDDGDHPNAAGHLLLAEAVVRALS